MKKFFVFAALLLVLSAAVFAQVISGGSSAMPSGSGNYDTWESPQSSATQGRYRSAADNFIRPDAYTSVSFDKFYAMTSFAGTNRAQLGFATKFGSLYMAAAYGGSFWAGYTPLNYSETEQPWDGKDKKTYPVYDIDPYNPFAKGGNTENRFAVLVGLPAINMGFRLAFSSINHEYINLSDFGAGSAGAQLKSYEADRGRIVPQLAWAMTKAFTPNGIQPYAVLDLGFVRNSIKYETAAGKGVQVGLSKNYFEPSLAIGLGGYTVYKNDSSFRLTADFDYVLGLQIYSNEYSYMKSNGDYESKSIDGYWDNYGYYEYSFSSHRIIPSIAAQWSGGPLALRLKLNMEVPIYAWDKSDKKLDADGNLEDVKNADGDAVTSNNVTAGFNPNLRLAAQWKIIPKLTLNAGGRIDISAGSLKTTNSTGSKEVSGTAGSSTITRFSLGFTFNPTDNLSFEASSSIQTSNNKNTLNTFDTTNGLFVFGGLLASIKF